MIGGVTSPNNLLNGLYSVGSVRTYAASLVDAALSTNANPWSSLLNGINSFNYNNTYQSTISATKYNTLSFASENAKNLTGLKDAAYTLSLAAGNFGATTLVSSDQDVLTANGTSYSSSAVSYSVNVSQTAAQNQQASAEFDAEESAVFAGGANSFAISTEKGKYNIAFEVGPDDTNRSALEKLAGAINSSRAGVTAKVVTEDGKSSLQVTSVDTGEKSAFSVESGGTGVDAAAKLGMSEIQAARDAVYSVNGQEFTSSGNTVGMPDGRAGTLTFISAGSAEVNRAVDASRVVAAAEAFATAYNKAVEHLAKNIGGGMGTERALNMIDGVGSVDNRTYARLAAMGITLGEEGMKVDAEKLTKAVRENPTSVKNTLGGYAGVAQTVQRGASEALRIPAATYTNFSNMRVSNSLIDALMPGTGFLLDLYG